MAAAKRWSGFVNDWVRRLGWLTKWAGKYTPELGDSPSPIDKFDTDELSPLKCERIASLLSSLY